ncbi:MAG: calcium-translocating P-type ATPase, PMCA-type [Bacteroidia bacterium]|nr:MAG: calcium-translocating P-type ATPase, PMCA-type [Bacteroidia bacterium]
MQEDLTMGLTSAQAERSRAQFGANTLSEPPRTSPWLLYLAKFRDPLIIILLVAWVLSVGIAFYTFYTSPTEGGELSLFLEPLGILFAVLLATGLSFYFEQQADREFGLLNQVNEQTAYQVLRDGAVASVPKADIVVGDIVYLNTGEEIPADGVLVEAISLQVDESSLTGEPVADKRLESQGEAGEEEQAYPAHCVYRATTVLEGHGAMRVSAVGDATETGKVFKGIQIENDVQTPLDAQLERLAKLISKAGYVLSGLLIVLRLSYYFYTYGAVTDWFAFGNFMLNTVMLAVTLLVVAVPEGLPMSVSLSLAYSMRSMMKTNNLVRRMHACETMGATTVICTDKTGTLTQNQMRVHELLLCDGQPPVAGTLVHRRIVECVCQNSTAHLEQKEGKLSVLGNPTEGALLLWAREQGVDYLGKRAEGEVVEQLTFSTQRKYMATLVQEPGGEAPVLLVKGAPEIVMGKATHWMDGEGEVRELEGLLPTLRERLYDFQRKGMRTLALAAYTPAGGEVVFAEQRVASERLILLSIVAISDPVRPDVPAAIAECQSAGISVKIVTGDTVLTAKEIARQIGLWDEGCTERSAISGPEFEAMSDEELLPRLKELRLMYRARPLDKSRLTRLLQQQGEVVAVTGDGTNDAPALRAANVGLSMGDGTSVAKEASDITILDNSFVSIGKAVLWGRSLYLNIQRFILFQLTINFAACMIVLLGVFFDGNTSPLTVTQMLWVNLVMDTLAALALASLPRETSLMKLKPRRPEDFIITPAMKRQIIGLGSVFVVVMLGMLFGFDRMHIYPTEVELSMFFSFFVFLQVWNIFNAKAFGTSFSAFHNLAGSRQFLRVVLFIALGQWVLMGFGGVLFDAVPLTLAQQLAIVGSTSLVLWAFELGRAIRRMGQP